MKLNKVTREELLIPLSSVSGIVERKHTLAVLSNVLLETKDNRLWMTAMDMELQISAYRELKTEDEEAATVSARKLQDLLRALPEDASISVETKGNKISVKAGRSRFNLQTLPAQDFPRLASHQENEIKFTLTQKNLKALIKQVEFAMAQQDIRFYLNGMLWVIHESTLQLVATDGHRLAWGKLPVEGNFAKQEVILPRKAVTELSKLLSDADETIEVAIQQNQVRFSFGAIEIISKVIDGKFPDFTRVIPSGYTKHIELNRQVLLDALQRAAVLSNEKVRGVHLMFSKNELKIVCNNNEQEEAEEQLEVAYEAEELSIGFNITYLLDALQRLNADKIIVSLDRPENSALITVPDNENYKYVVMPMKI
ncbi:MAG: DNA polymerase III subunit beta [Burkholderiales bacterium]|jgi:DNA polymerase-3 subunit beta|nr:DNA polymerase III subunit beta [Burkholderiales bacterium]